MILADLDDDFAGMGKPISVADLPQQWLANGLYTLTFPCGSHRTIRIHTQKKGPMAGRRLLSLLIGPDNTTDYERFGELTADGYKVWKRHANGKPGEYAFLLWSLAKGEEIDGHELLISKRCLKCNRTLNDPESIKAGLGPECRKSVSR